MKTLFKLPVYLMFGAAMFGFASCSDDNNDDATVADDVNLQPIVEQFVSGTVNPTYKLLADATEDLCNKLTTLRDKAKAGTEISDQELVDVTKVFLNARKYYEESEAFLFGAASDYGIDPHIDSWPLSEEVLVNALVNDQMVESLDSDNGQTANGSLGQSVLGFHGIEYILFRDGKPRTYADMKAGLNSNHPEITAKLQLIFARAVAADLRNSCYRMEVCWNANATKSHIDWLTSEEGVGDLEWSTTALNSDYTYGDYMLKAGQPGIRYTSWRSAVSEIVKGGCQNIADEVGETKLGNPITGADESYIESPYSKNSKTDFVDNLISIENVYMGGREDSRDESKSLHAYLQKNNPALDTRLTAAITKAKAAIMAINGDGALVDYIKDHAQGDRAQGQAAIDACKEVSDALSAIDDYILNGK